MLTPDCTISPDIKNNITYKKSILVAPFGNYTSTDLQTHFVRRQNVDFFPVCEADQTTRDFIGGVLKNRFVFNHETHCFGSTVNWLDNPSDDIEWQIFLHKGYYLVGLMKFYSETGDRQYLDKWIELTESWIDQVDDPGFIASDITGRRIQNWIYAFYYLIKGKPDHVGAEIFLRFLSSLENQVNYLIKNLAKARNHRTLELHAIFLAAVVFPEFKKAQSWLRFSVDALADNAATDILADGVHCELSTYYHHIVLKNLLSVKRLAITNNITMPKRFDAAVIRALDFSMYIHKPDGLIPTLSDGDIDSFYHLLEQGYKLYGNNQWRYVFSQGKAGLPPKPNAKAFAVGGYYVLRSSWDKQSEPFQDARYLVFDCGPLGAGNHGHLDLLNIEVAAFGRSLIVDPGRYSYDESGASNWRALFRSTRYHNTVEVDGKNQVDYRYSKAKGKFHIQGPHAQAVASDLHTRNACHLIRGKAWSYQYTAVHERKIFFAGGEYWLISDVLQDLQVHQYALNYHLSSKAQDQITIDEQGQFTVIDSPNLLLIHPYARPSQTSIEPGFISNSYGKKSQAPIIKFQRSAKNTVFETILIPYKQQRPEITFQALDTEISSEKEAWGEACSFSLSVKTSTNQIQDLFFIAHDGMHKRRWQYQNIECTGKFCYLRLNSAGKIENFFTEKGGSIKVDGQLLTAREL